MSNYSVFDIELQAGGKPSTWLPPGGLAEWLQATEINHKFESLETKKTIHATQAAET